MSRTIRRKSEKNPYNCISDYRFHSDFLWDSWGWKSNRHKNFAKKLTHSKLRRMQREENRRIMKGEFDAQTIHNKDHKAVHCEIAWRYT
tara:strand:- start:544 stop:810 length:267 start_codon:yes stop_codon:yes gene_type:complete